MREEEIDPEDPKRCEIRTLPCAGIIQIRFKGYFSPATHRQSSDGCRYAAQDPRVSSRNNTPRRSVLATICNTHACVCIAYCIMATTVFSRMRFDIFYRNAPDSRRLMPAFKPLSSFGTLLPDPFFCFRHVVLPCPFCRDAQAAYAPFFTLPGFGRSETGVFQLACQVDCELGHPAGWRCNHLRRGVTDVYTAAAAIAGFRFATPPLRATAVTAFG